MTRKNLGRAAFAALPFVLALIAELVVLVVVRDRLPERLAVHFDARGTADGREGLTGYVLTTVPVSLGLGALWAYSAVRGRMHGRLLRRFLGGGFALAAFTGYLMTAVLIANADAPEGGPADGFPMSQLAAALGAAVLAGVLGTWAARLVPAGEEPPAGPAERERIALADGEVVGWVRSVGAWWAPLTVLALLVAGVAAGRAQSWFIGAPLIAVALVAGTFCRPHVTVDRRGLTVSGLLPRPRLRVPLERMAGADSRRVDAVAEFGGWGYRVRPERSGVIVRSGEAIVVSLRNGREFAVTVEDSATGAALLNSLLDRPRTGC